MDVWVGRCNKTVKCSYCNEDITVGSPMVLGKLWMRFSKEGAEPRRWVRNFRWHAKRVIDGQCCWLVQAMEEFGKVEYIERRGRKKLVMSKEKREQRLCVLRQRARLVQRIKLLMLAPDGGDIDRIIRIGSQLEELKTQIETLGGIPKSWL